MTAMKALACICCGTVNTIPKEAMTDPNFKPFDPDDNLLKRRPQPDEPTAIETQRDREIESLRNEVMWLRESHRHMIEQLASRAALLPPVYLIGEPAPVVWTNFGRPPLRPGPDWVKNFPVSRDRLGQLLSIEKAAKRVASPIVRSQYGASGNVLVPLPLITEMIAAINAIEAINDSPVKD